MFPVDFILVFSFLSFGRMLVGPKIQDFGNT